MSETKICLILGLTLLQSHSDQQVYVLFKLPKVSPGTTTQPAPVSENLAHLDISKGKGLKKTINLPRSSLATIKEKKEYLKKCLNCGVTYTSSYWFSKHSKDCILKKPSLGSIPEGLSLLTKPPSMSEGSSCMAPQDVVKESSDASPTSMSEGSSYTAPDDVPVESSDRNPLSLSDVVSENVSESSSDVVPTSSPENKTGKGITYPRQCSRCKKFYRNKDCFRYHLQKSNDCRYVYFIAGKSDPLRNSIYPRKCLVCCRTFASRSGFCMHKRKCKPYESS
ncbi:hypothetical protein JTE90_019827 [Oedothorax gibbosus]|uniref:C2H2-type domain-containing protein n=1 Tax=Oedothorax gibbosus TaxID=931172 RepID=A0AAV6V7P4_9ARAC|nr:hypothetical protein JTE90_019827 [Oedothorax gibbosus]